MIRFRTGVPLPLACLAACGTASALPTDEGLDVLRIDVDHPTAAVAILDGVGEQPLVAAVGGGVVTILGPDGEGTLEVREVVPAGEHAVDLAAGDLDHDGSLDLVVANHETTYLTIVFGAETGFADARSESLTVDVSPHPHAVALADVDEDGHLDILVDDRDRDALKGYPGQGDGSFGAAYTLGVGGDPYRGMSVADLDGDGHLDVITPNPRSVAIRLGDATGTFHAGVDLESGSVPPFSTVVADLNGDGWPDVAAGSGEGPGYVMVWLAGRGGSFHEAPGAPYSIAQGPTKLAVADVNGDGIDDLLVTSYLENEITILPGGQTPFRPIRIELDDYPWGVAAGDVTGDGAIDLVVANDGGERITLLRGR